MERGGLPNFLAINLDAFDPRPPDVAPGDGRGVQLAPTYKRTLTQTYKGAFQRLLSGLFGLLVRSIHAQSVVPNIVPQFFFFFSAIFVRGSAPPRDPLSGSSVRGVGGQVTNKRTRSGPLFEEITPPPRRRPP